MTATEFNTFITKQRRSFKRRAAIPYQTTIDPLDVLMAHRSLPMKLNLGPEDRLAVLLADCLRTLSKLKLLNAVWLHIPNESKRSELAALLLRRMGLISGATDYIFASPVGSGLIEIKVKPNTMSPNQEYFRDWCKALLVNHACFTCSADTYEARRATVIAILTRLNDWGFIPDLRAAMDALRDKLANPVSIGHTV